MKGAYYNEIDPFAAQWLRNLISAGLIAPGEVDERSITEVRGSDLAGFTQCHFFAGIGGWSLALRMAEWPDNLPVWTGSCPCQPFSNAGKRGGSSDPRHLWPEFHRLIAECGPPIVFGEQVASKDGRGWLTGVRADLEELVYAVGVADLCAASVKAPHVRQRLYWVANPRSTDVSRPVEVRSSLRSFMRETSTLNGDDGLAPWVSIHPNQVPVESLDGFSRPVGVVRAYGNAIVPQVAAEFISAYREAVIA